MSRRILAIGIVVGGALLAACTQQSGSEGSNDTAADAGAWQAPKTTWGDPDLRGKWPISHLIGTPFTRPAKYGDRRYMSDQEFAETEAGLEGRNTAYNKEIKRQQDGHGPLGRGHGSATAHVADRRSAERTVPGSHAKRRRSSAARWAAAGDAHGLRQA